MPIDVRELDLLERVIVDVKLKDAMAEGVRLRNVLKDIVLRANWDGYTSPENRLAAIEKEALDGLHSDTRFRDFETFEQHVYETVQQDYSPEFEARVRSAIRKAGLPK